MITYNSITVVNIMPCANNGSAVLPDKTDYNDTIHYVFNYFVFTHSIEANMKVHLRAP